MRVLITGSTGQLGRALLRQAPVEHDITAVGHKDVDITSREEVEKAVAVAAPQVIVNAAAYTAVDRAETEREQAFAANARGPQILARVAAASGARLIHISTDFVFDGRAGTPYSADAVTNPLGIYGMSKCEGEQAVLQTTGCASVVLRTAWVYSAHGHNFVRTMLRLMKEKGQVRVVADQVGSPTSADSVARALWAIASRPRIAGVHHWTDAGIASWYDFAVAIAEEAVVRGLLAGAVSVEPIATADFPTPARRPAYSVLDKAATIGALGFGPQHWRNELRTVLEELQLG